MNPNGRPERKRKTKKEKYKEEHIPFDAKF